MTCLRDGGANAPPVEAADSRLLDEVIPSLASALGM
jgi:hypothetical protein